MVAAATEDGLRLPARLQICYRKLCLDETVSLVRITAPHFQSAFLR